MNAAQFLLADGRPSNVWYCTACKKTKVSFNKELAEKCCQPHLCIVCGEVVKTDSGNYACIHRSCYVTREAEKTAAAIAKAEKFDSWDGPVYLDGVGQQDGFFDSLDALIDYLVDDENGDDTIDWPEYVFVGKGRSFVAVDADRILENISEDAYEDWDTPMNGVEEFQAACKAFNEANKGQLVYHVDRKRVVKIPARSECVPPPNAD